MTPILQVRTQMLREVKGCLQGHLGCGKRKTRTLANGSLQVITAATCWHSWSEPGRRLWEPSWYPEASASGVVRVGFWAEAATAQNCPCYDGGLHVAQPQEAFTSLLQVREAGLIFLSSMDEETRKPRTSCSKSCSLLVCLRLS